MPLDTPAKLTAPAIGLTPRLLRFGYIPLTDAAPLLAAEALGLFRAAGLRVLLSRETAWAALRDKLASGALEAAHLLGPTAIAMATGASGLRRQLIVTSGLARNGNTLILSAAFLDPGDQVPLDAHAFAARLRQRATDGLRAPILAVVFLHSSHNYLLRHWLAESGLDPDHDVRLVVIPPPEMARAMDEGIIDGFCAGEPWGSDAVATGTGKLALATGDIWQDHPEKVLAFAEGALERDREAVLAATAAILQAQLWLDTPVNREAAAALLHEHGFPALPVTTVAAALRGEVAAAHGGQPQRLATPMRFADASRPRVEEAGWWFDAMRRWRHLPAETSREAALAPWRPDIWHEAAARLSPALRATLPDGHAGIPPSHPQEPLA